VTRTVRDAAAVFAVAEKTGPDTPFQPLGVVSGPGRRKLRIGWMAVDATGRPADAEVAHATAAAADLCHRLGHQVEEARWPDLGRGFAQAFLTLWSTGGAEVVEKLAKAEGHAPGRAELEPFTLAMAEHVRGLPRNALAEARQAVSRAAAIYVTLFTRYDVVLTPVLSSPPVKLGYLRGDVAFALLVERLTAYVGYTPIVNVTGNTAMSVPLAWTHDGLPLGAQFAAAPGQERILFELAYALEEARPWAQRKPPVRA
jgi:amidase